MEQPSRFQKILATGFGTGYSPKAPGTAGALFMWGIWALLYALLPFDVYFPLFTVLFLLLTYYGTKASTAVEAIWGKDPSRVVVDEMVGVLIPLMTIVSDDIWFYYSILAFVSFRFFDILKPLGIKKLEKWNGGVRFFGHNILAGNFCGLFFFGC